MSGPQRRPAAGANPQGCNLPALSATPTVPTSCATSRIASAAAVGLVLSVAVVLLVLGLAFDSGPDFLLATAAVLSAALAVVLGVAVENPRRLLSPGLLYPVLHVVHFAFPALLLSLGVTGFVFPTNRPYALEGLLLSTLCMVSVATGNWIATRGAVNAPRAERTRRLWAPTRVLVTALVLEALGWSARALVVAREAYLQVDRATQGGLEGPLYAVIRLMETLPLHCLVLLVIHHCSTRPQQGCAVRWSRRPGALVFLCLLGLEFAYWLPTGRKEETILAGVLPWMARYLFDGRRPRLRAAFAAALAVVAVFQLSAEYRAGMRPSEDWGAGTRQNMLESTDRLFGGQASGASLVDNILGRLGLLENVSAAIRLRQDGPWGRYPGEQYVWLAVGLVPRVLWTEKPGFHYGNEFGYLAGYLQPGDQRTSVSVTFWGEAFLNFSWFGALVPALMGFVFGSLSRLAFQSASLGWALIFVLVMPAMLYVGGTFALYFGGVLRTGLMYWIIDRMMRK